MHRSNMAWAPDAAAEARETMFTRAPSHWSPGGCGATTGRGHRPGAPDVIAGGGLRPAMHLVLCPGTQQSKMGSHVTGCLQKHQKAGMGMR